MKLFILAFCLSFDILCSADTSPGFYYERWYSIPPQRDIKVLDEKFFDAKETKPTKSISGRYYADDADCNSQQRAEWIKTCQSFRSKDFSAFRDCFNKEKEKALSLVRSQFEAVEKRQAEPYRNAYP